MSTIQENLRTTLLSLKQISDRLKLLNTTSVTKSEALAYKNEIIGALGDIDFTEITEALDSIDGKIGTAPAGSDKATIFAWITSLYDYVVGQDPEDIPEGLGDRINLLLQFFGIAGTYEAEAVGQETTDNPVINECKTRYAEVFGDLLPSDFVMPNSVTIDGTTYSGTVS